MKISGAEDPHKAEFPQGRVEKGHTDMDSYITTVGLRLGDGNGYCLGTVTPTLCAVVRAQEIMLVRSQYKCPGHGKCSIHYAFYF